MVNWESQSVIATDMAAVKIINIFCLGLYAWEFSQTLWFEWALITCRFPFKWPHIPYLLGRYCLICYLSSFILVYETTIRINCEAAFTAFPLIVDIAIGCSSTNLLIRTLIIWRRERFMIVLLILISVGHWATLFIVSANNLQGRWDDATLSCVVTHTSSRKMACLYLYTMLFDFLILAATVVGLARARSQSLLWMTLYRQGIVYFVITFVANVVPCAFAWLDLNATMNVVFTTPAACASIIASSRTVTSLLQSGNPECEISQSDSERPRTSCDRKQCRLFCLPVWTKQVPVSQTKDSVGWQLSTRLSIPPASTYDPMAPA